MKKSFLILFSFILTAPLYLYSQTESLKDYFYSANNKSDTLFYGRKIDKLIFFKRTADYTKSDTVTITDFSPANIFLHSYKFLITDTTISVLSSKTNLNNKQIVDNKILAGTWLTKQRKQAYYDSRCVDTSHEGDDSYWEWENRHQTQFHFESILFKNRKVSALVVSYHNYILNQPRSLSANIFFKDYREKMTFVKGVGLISITQNGTDKSRHSFTSTLKNKGGFSTCIELLDK